MGATLLRAMAKNYAGGHAWDDLDAKACTEAADHIDALAARVAELENEVREANGRADAHEKLAESCFNDAVRFRWAAESKQFQYWLSTNSPDEARAAIDAAITAAGTGGGE